MREMKEFFKKRTKEHIDRVQKFANLLANEFDELSELKEIVKFHDASKYKEPEYTPYLYITWDYKCKRNKVEFKIPKKIQDNMSEASNHHVLSNPHHPEYHSGETQDVINKEDRDKPDKPDKLINSRKMSDVYIAEMVSDWSAMSEEYKEEGPYKWAKDNINVRWKFTNKQVDLIYKYIDFLWKGK